MAYAINFFGWCSEGNHDKVWGYVTVQNEELYNFWGRRGKRFSFQKQEGATWLAADNLHHKARDKCRSGRASGTYQDIPINQIETVWPGFYDEFEMQLTMAKISGRFRGATVD
jgi:hypothetical protein